MTVPDKQTDKWTERQMDDHYGNSTTICSDECIAH